MSDFDCMKPVFDVPQEIDYEEPTQKITIFDIINDISTHGSYIENFYELNRSLPKEFNSFMILKAFANFQDTLFLANELNKHPNIPDESQWRFLKETVTKRKRYSKWFRNLEDEEPIVMLAKYFNCSLNEMRKNINVLSKERQLEILQELDPERFKKRNSKKVSK